ncbi:MAG: glycerophosphodiester phosphodiesterase [Methanobacteriota archaeon]
MLVIAHRGAHLHAPENSMEAFRLAVAQGADGIEQDVRTTSDEVAVAMHDPTLKRTAGDNAAVSDLTHSRLSRTRLANGETVPTLEEVLDAFGGKTTIYAELKDRGAAPELERLAARIPHARITASSFDPLALAGLESAPKALLWDRRGSPIADAVGSGCIEIHPRLRRAAPRMVDDAHAQGIRVIVWDVRNPRGVSTAMRIGADGIMADDILMAKDAISRLGKNI